MSFLSRVGSLFARGFRAWYRFITTRKTKLGTAAAAIGSLVVFCCVLSLALSPFTGKSAQTVATAQVTSVAQVSATTALPTVPPTATQVPQPTRTPQPTATLEPTTVARPTADVSAQAYLLTVQSQMSILGNALTQFGTLMQQPKLGDAQWVAELKKHEAAIQDADTSLRTLKDVPPAYADAHKALLEATGACNLAVSTATQAVDPLDIKKLQSATALMQDCSAKTQTAIKTFPT
jgi:hypothetical protein